MGLRLGTSLTMAHAAGGGGGTPARSQLHVSKIAWLVMHCLREVLGRNCLLLVLHKMDSVEALWLLTAHAHELTLHGSPPAVAAP